MTTNLLNQTLLNQYRVDAFVASGGMGAVYRVWDLKRNVPLAMKVLHAELAEDPTVFKRFQREARALQKLAHPNIVPFYGLFQTHDTVFLLERYVDGPTLKEILQQRQGQPLPPEEALIYLKALCAALGYAHVKGVVHCDVKPGNVMIDPGGNIYLTDFGIARHADSTTTTVGAAGTPAYMAPEQVRGEQVTPATDVYALGVMLFEMLTGQRPFRGSETSTESAGPTAAERIRYAQQHLQPPDPCTINPMISPDMAQVVMRALVKQPEGRYRSAQELFETACSTVNITPQNVPDRIASLPVPGLAAGAAQMPIGAAQVGPAARTFSYTGLAFVLGGLLLAVVLLVGGVLVAGSLLTGGGRSKEAGDQTVRPVAAATSTRRLTVTPSPVPPLPQQVTDTSGAPHLPTLTPTQTNDIGAGDTAIAQTLAARQTITARAIPSETPTLNIPTTTPTSESRISLQNANQITRLATLEGHSDHVASVDFSPDGQYLASGSYDKTAILWQVADGNLLYTLRGHSSSVFKVSFSPDGSTLATGSNDGTIRLWNANNGSQITALTGYKASVMGVDFSPDGQRLVVGLSNNLVVIESASDGTDFFEMAGHTSALEDVAFSPNGAYVASGADDNTARLWDANTGKFLQTFNHSGKVLRVAFSPDSTLLATVSDANEAYLWSTSNGQRLQSLSGHTDQVAGVAFVSNEIVATASFDKTVRLWDTTTGTLLTTLPTGNSGVCVAASPDGKYLAVGLYNGSVQVWGISP